MEADVSGTDGKGLGLMEIHHSTNIRSSGVLKKREPHDMYIFRCQNHLYGFYIFRYFYLPGRKETAFIKEASRSSNGLGRCYLPPTWPQQLCKNPVCCCMVAVWKTQLFGGLPIITSSLVNDSL